MLVVDKNTTPIDWLKFEYEQQQQRLQAMQTLYVDKKLGLTVPELLEKFKLE